MSPGARRAHPSPGKFPAATGDHVRFAMEGNLDSLSWLIARFSPLLLIQAEYRLGPALRNLYDPQDVVNDVWNDVLPAMPDVSSPPGRSTQLFLRYISSALARRVRDLLEKHILGKPKARPKVTKPTDAPKEESLAILASSTELVSVLVKGEQRGRVYTSLRDLETADREVMILRGIEQRPAAEVAGMLGLAPQVVSVRYHRALRRLRDKLPGSIFFEMDDTHR